MNADEDYSVLLTDDILMAAICSQSVQEICDDYLNPYRGSREERSIYETA